MGAMPMGFLGKSDTTWESIVKKPRITIGTMKGSFSEIVAKHLEAVYPQVDIIPYPGPTEADRDVASGQIDLSIDVPGMILPQKQLYNYYHITGKNDYNKKFTLASTMSSGFGDLTLEFAVLAPSTMDPVLAAKLQLILKNAHDNNPALKDLYQNDYVAPIRLSPTEWYDLNIKNWKKITQNIKIE
jgi:tripartite-type tricarboxylate transporter receptor subunit TctC